MAQKNFIEKPSLSPSTPPSPKQTWSAWLRRFARIVNRISTLFVALAISFGTPLLASQDNKKPGRDKQDHDVNDRLRVRYLNGQEETVTILRWNKDGVLVKRYQIAKPVFQGWSSFDPETATMLKKRYLGAVTGPTTSGIKIPGVRVRTKEGVFLGALVPQSPADEIHLKTSQGNLIFKLSDVLSQEKVRVDITAVHTPAQIEAILMIRLRPSRARDWERFGSKLIRMGLKGRAILAFRRAEILRRTDRPEGRLYRSLLTLGDALLGLTEKKLVVRIQNAFLAGRFKNALERVNDLERGLTSEFSLRELRRIRAAIRQLRDQSREDQIIAEWMRLIDVNIRARAFDRKIGFAQAVEYVRTELLADVLNGVRERFQFSKTDPTPLEIWQKRNPRSVLKHSFGDGTWPVVRPDLGNVHSWWDTADESVRDALLKGIAIQKHFHVLREGSKNCPTCGGTGRLDGAPDGICPACRALRSQKVVFFR